MSTSFTARGWVKRAVFVLSELEEKKVRGKL